MSEIQMDPGKFKISSLVIVRVLNFWECRAPKDSDVNLKKPKCFNGSLNVTDKQTCIYLQL